jgi:AraC-like DNA-binding protein
VLSQARLNSATFRSLVLRGDWRLRFDGLYRGVHIIAAGNPFLILEDGTSLALGPGDLVVLPRADIHTLASSRETRCNPYSSHALATTSSEVELAFGFMGDETRIVCGVFFFEDDEHPAVAGLPRCVHVPAGSIHTEWLQALGSAVIAEATERGPGSDLVMARLSNMLITRALRYHLETTPEPGWLHGLRDSAIARSLSAIHGRLAEPWTVATLADCAGMSRTAFAARFTELVGVPPIEYLYRCRMQRAETLLRNDQLTVANVAKRVGYGSESALSAAFFRHAGMTPGAFRRSGQSRVESDAAG